MKPIQYFLLLATALCVSQWNNFGREPQRGFGPRFSNNQNNRFGQRFSNNQNNRFGPRFSNNQNRPTPPNYQDNGFGPIFSNNRFDPRFTNHPMEEPRFKPPQNQNTYLQPQENQLNLNTQPEQAPEAEVQVFGSMYFNGEHLQLPEQQLQALFNPLFEQLVKIEQKLNNDEQLTEQQIL